MATQPDRLTQLQDPVDQIATQFFSALRYIGTHHDAVPVGNETKFVDEANSLVDKPEASSLVPSPAQQ